jgi:hypothetical protein
MSINQQDPPNQELELRVNQAAVFRLSKILTDQLILGLAGGMSG